MRRAGGRNRGTIRPALVQQGADRLTVGTLRSSYIPDRPET